MYRIILIALLQLLLTACASLNLVTTHTTVYPPTSVDTVTIAEPAQVAQTPTAPPTFEIVDPDEAKCLAQAMYFEARGEGERGMLAVGYVVHNRKHSERFKPKTYCGIVREGRHVNGRVVRNACQFSFYCDGRPDKIVDKVTFAKALRLAEAIMQGSATNPVGPSIYFHERSASWKYAKRYTRIARIGNHIFYA